MNYEITEAVQQAITPGEHFDNFYSSEECVKKAAYATLQDNRFTVALSSKSFGSTSVVNYNPEQGLGDIVLTLQLPDSSGAAYTNAALDAGFAYRAVKSLGIRIGGSSLYYWTGSQLAIEVISDCEDSVKRDAMFQLGGVKSDNCATDFAAGGNSALRTAYLYIKCPWNSPSQQEKPVPLPTDLLTQPVQFLIQLATANEIFTPNGNGPMSGLPTEFALAEMCFRQIHMQDAGMLLARRENMNEKAYSLPLRYFAQTVFQANVPAQSTQELGNPVQINLTGFRQGQIGEIVLYMVRNADIANGCGLRLQPMSNVRLLINGLVYYDSRAGSNEIWSLVERKTPANWNYLQAGEADSLTAPYVVIPFGQKFDVLTGDSVVRSGYPIMNSVVNLSFTVSAASTAYTLFAEYRYNSNLLFSKGSAEYVF